MTTTPQVDLAEARKLANTLWPFSPSIRNNLSISADAIRALADEVEALRSRLEAHTKAARAYMDTVYRVHDALKDAGWHPGRTYDLIDDIIKAKGKEFSSMQSELAALKAVGPDVDWSNSATMPTELWKNRLYSIADRLQMADGAVAYERSVVQNLREQLEAVKAVGPDGLPPLPDERDAFESWVASLESSDEINLERAKFGPGLEYVDTVTHDMFSAFKAGRAVLALAQKGGE